MILDRIDFGRQRKTAKKSRTRDESLVWRGLFLDRRFLLLLLLLLLFFFLSALLSSNSSSSSDAFFNRHRYAHIGMMMMFWDHKKLFFFFGGKHTRTHTRAHKGSLLFLFVVVVVSLRAARVKQSTTTKNTLGVKESIRLSSFVSFI